jgi:hypothetical protein
MTAVHHRFGTLLACVLVVALMVGALAAVIVFSRAPETPPVQAIELRSAATPSPATTPGGFAPRADEDDRDDDDPFDDDED